MKNKNVHKSDRVRARNIPLPALWLQYALNLHMVQFAILVLRSSCGLRSLEHTLFNQNVPYVIASFCRQDCGRRASSMQQQQHTHLGAMSQMIMDLLSSLTNCFFCFPGSPQLKINNRSFKMQHLLGEVGRPVSFTAQL